MYTHIVVKLSKKIFKLKGLVILQYMGLYLENIKHTEYMLLKFKLFYDQFFE